MTSSSNQDRKYRFRWYSFCFSEYFLLFMLITFLESCTPFAYIDRGNDSNIGSETSKKGSLFRVILSDSDYFSQGISYMGITGQEPDYNKAKSLFEFLLKKYPHSELKSTTLALIHFINDIQICLEKNRSDQIIYGKIDQENERLKRDSQLLNEKQKSEIARLLQENISLKKDIEQLKDLEINLDKRERLLR